MDTICCHSDTKSFFVSRKIGRVTLWDPRDPVKSREWTPPSLSGAGGMEKGGAPSTPQYYSLNVINTS
eukprot:scaffold51493_cov87-Cyclotella_meneghiniana.AAC.1